MKKLTLVAAVVFAGMVLFSPVASAQNFDVSVDIPAADSLSFTLWKLFDGEPFPTTPEAPGSGLVWAESDLTFVAEDDLGNPINVFFGNHFYAIDVAPSGGAGTLSVLIQWNETADPDGALNDGTNGLDVHGVATVVKAFPDPDGPGGLPIPAEEVLEREVLANINNTTISAAVLAAGTTGFMRMYVGLATGDPAADPAEPAAAVPFNLGNAPGIYAGTITLSVAP